jgi:hypothetical protein
MLECCWYEAETSTCLVSVRSTDKKKEVLPVKNIALVSCWTLLQNIEYTKLSWLVRLASTELRVKRVSFVFTELITYAYSRVPSQNEYSYSRVEVTLLAGGTVGFDLDCPSGKSNKLVEQQFRRSTFKKQFRRSTYKQQFRHSTKEQQFRCSTHKEQ